MEKRGEKRRGEGRSREAERGMARVRGMEGKKRRASCYTPRVCFSSVAMATLRRFVTVMGWEKQRELESPTLVGDTCFNRDYPVERDGETALSGERFRSICPAIFTIFSYRCTISRRVALDESGPLNRCTFRLV